MLRNRKNIFLTCIMVCAVLVIGVILNIQTGHAGTSDAEVKIRGSVNNEIQTNINNLRISKGAVQLTAQTHNAFGKQLLVCEDQQYKYYINSEDNVVVAGVLNDKGFAKLSDEQVSLAKSEYLSIGNKLKGQLFTDFDWENSKVTFDYEFNPENYAESVCFEINERNGDCLVNWGVFSLAKDGTLTTFAGTNNSIEDFKDTDKYDKIALKEIILDQLININKTERNGGLTSIEVNDEVEKTDPPLQPGDINPEDEQIGKPEVKYPEYEMFIKTVDDINFLRMEKTKLNDSIVWEVDAQINTSWGKLDDIFNSIYCFRIDARAGNVELVDILSGAK